MIHHHASVCGAVWQMEYRCLKMHEWDEVEVWDRANYPGYTPEMKRRESSQPSLQKARTTGLEICITKSDGRRRGMRVIALCNKLASLISLAHEIVTLAPEPPDLRKQAPLPQTQICGTFACEACVLERRKASWSSSKGLPARNRRASGSDPFCTSYSWLHFEAYERRSQGRVCGSSR